ncbi:MAG: hypothetical protein EBY55_10915 [Gammaproteobacteria bacterium]|nr:hypothetical protein [Gammaproteobacteria bacterium]
MDERRDSTLIDEHLIDEERVWHGLRPLIDASITFGCSANVFPDRIAGSVVAMASQSAMAYRGAVQGDS